MNAVPDLSRLRLGTRIASTALILLMAAFAALAARAIGPCVEIYENVVTGGRDPIPRLTRIVMNCDRLALVIPVLVPAGALFLKWSLQKLPAILTVLFVALFLRLRVP